MALLRRGERTGTAADFLVVGLGNPGDEYRHTRHNVGADVVELLSTRHGAPLRVEKGLHARAAIAHIGGARVALAVPTTYMNESGAAVAPLVRRFGVEPEQIVIVHDELDLAPNVLRLKEGGGLAGHNGLRSIKAALKTDTFLRVRIGVGKPVSKERGADHVLSRMGKRDRAEMDVTVEQAADAVEAIVADGIQTAMHRFHSAT